MIDFERLMVKWLILFVMIRVGGALCRDDSVQKTVLPTMERCLRIWFGKGKAVKYFRWMLYAVEMVTLVKFLYASNRMTVLSVGWLISMMLVLLVYATFELLCIAAKNVHSGKE